VILLGAAILCGGLVGFSLGLIGGGGSILAVPLLLYVVGVSDRWRSAALFAAAGVVGAAGGSTVGKQVDGHRLLVLFALLMLLIAFLMLRGRRGTGAVAPPRGRAAVLRTLGLGFGVGAIAGFYGIGGGFLIVPGLIFATAMPMIDAVGTSLVAVGAFGLTTAVNYSLSGLVDWTVAGLFISGGIAGGWGGALLATRLAVGRNTLTRVFGGVLVAVAIYMLARSLGG
jgi:uncharacterized membrane protein YfcA